MTDDEHEQGVDHVFLRRAAGWIAAASEEGALRVLLVDFAGYLEVHFAAEERAGGFFQQVVETAPQRSPTIDALRNEHRAMLAATAALADALRDEPTAASPEVRERVAALVKDLQRHEAREVALLQVLDRELGEAG